MMQFMEIMAGYAIGGALTAGVVAFFGELPRIRRWFKEKERTAKEPGEGIAINDRLSTSRRGSDHDYMRSAPHEAKGLYWCCEAKDYVPLDQVKSNRTFTPERK